MGRWVREGRSWGRFSIAPSGPCTLSPAGPTGRSGLGLGSEMEAMDSVRASLVFLRPLAGALAVRRSRWSLMERVFRAAGELASTEDLEERLKKPLMPRSW